MGKPSLIRVENIELRLPDKDKDARFAVTLVKHDYSNEINEIEMDLTINDIYHLEFAIKEFKRNNNLK